MFSGIISDVGKILSIDKKEGAVAITFQSKFKTVSIGDSIAVEGVCLTVTKKKKLKSGTAFTMDLSEETMRQTTFGKKKDGDPVNLERSLRLSDPVGGHFVQGHVDGTGTITKILPEANSKLYFFSFPERLKPCVVPKGSISVDGISLTIAKVEGNSFAVSIIPYTEEKTSLGSKKAGDPVNLESDILTRTIVHQFKILRGEAETDLYQKKPVSWDQLASGELP